MLLGRAISGAGGWMQTTAASWYVLQQTGQATSVGFIVASAMLPSVLLNPVGGVLADRYSPVLLQKRLALLAAIGPLVVAGLFFTGELAVIWVYILVFLSAIPRALASPLMTEILPLSVPKELRASILANGAVTYNIARTVGPLIGGSIDVGMAFLINGLSYVVLAAIMQFTPLHEAETQAKSEIKNENQKTGGPETYKNRVKEGWSLPFVRAVFISAIMFYLAAGSVHQLLATVADDSYQTSGHLGVLFAAIAVGGIAANPFVKRYVNGGGSKITLLYMALIGAGPTIIALGLSQWLLSDLLILFLLGAFGEAMWLGAQQSIALDVPRHISGSMLGLFFAMTALATVVGSLLFGLLFDLIGVRSGLVMLGAVSSVYGLLQIWLIARSNKDQSDPSPSQPSSQ